MPDLTEKQAIDEMRRRLPWSTHRSAWGGDSVSAYIADRHGELRVYGRANTYRTALNRLFAVCRKAGLEVKP